MVDMYVVMCVISLFISALYSTYRGGGGGAYLDNLKHEATHIYSEPTGGSLLRYSFLEWNTNQIGA